MYNHTHKKLSDFKESVSRLDTDLFGDVFMADGESEVESYMTEVINDALIALYNAIDNLLDNATVTEDPKEED